MCSFFGVWNVEKGPKVCFVLLIHLRKESKRFERHWNDYFQKLSSGTHVKRSCQSAWRLLHHLALSGQEDEGLVGGSCDCHAENVDVGCSSRSRSCNTYIFSVKKKMWGKLRLKHHHFIWFDMKFYDGRTEGRALLLRPLMVSLADQCGVFAVGKTERRFFARWEWMAARIRRPGDVLSMVGVLSFSRTDEMWHENER